MGINGLLTDVRWEWTGTELTANLLAGATVLPVLDPESITVGEFVWIADTGPYEIVGADVDAATFTITPGLSLDVDNGTEVANDVGGQPGRAWVCEVILADADVPIEVPLTIHDLAVMPEGSYNPPVSIVLSDDLERVEDLPGSLPIIDGAYIPDLPPPSSGGGNNIFHQPEPPWPNGEAGHQDNDLWYDTDYPDGITPFIWDADNLIWVDASDPKVDLLDDISSVPVGDTTVGDAVDQGNQNTETSQNALNLAATADGRVSFSDYDPTPEDSTYYVTNPDGSLAKSGKWEILQAALSGGLATLRVGDASMAMANGEFIIVEGLGFPFDGEHPLDSSAATSLTVTSGQLIAGVATLQVTPANPWIVGQIVIVSGLDSTLNGEVTLTAVTGASVSYAVAGAPPDIPSGAMDGTVSLYTVTYGIPNEPNQGIPDAPVGAFGYNTIIQNRVEGSVWFTRTRSRKNYCTNPSFGIDTTGWVGVAAAIARVLPGTLPLAGTHVLQVTNTAAAGDHRAEWAGGAPGRAVLPGETYAVTGFALLVSGDGDGAFASVRFYDAASVLIDEVEGDAVLLSTTDWQELKVSATVPPTAAFMSAINLHNPNPSSVWLADGGMVEIGEYTGRYFDGDFYDAIWGEADPAHPGVKPGLGVPHTTFSTMFGGKIIDVWELTDGGWVSLDFTGLTTSDADAGDLTTGFLPPARLSENSISIGKSKTNSVRVSDAVTAGMFVNIWNNGGLFFVRPASAAQTGFSAHGFVLQDGAVGTAVPVYTWGYNPLCLGQLPGRQFLSATNPGKVSSAVPQTPGQIIQMVGVASDATTVQFTPQSPVLLY